MSHSPDRKPSTSSPRRHSRSPISKRESPNSKRINGWQSFSEKAGGRPRQDFRSHRRNGSKGSKSSNVSHSTNSSGHSGHARGRGSVYYTKHIAFYGGVLSNFHQGNRFTGAAVFKHLLPKLAELNIPHPSIDSIATQLISQHNFLCGEQFMMAMKAFLFEMPGLALAIQTPETLWTEYTTNLYDRLYSTTPAYNNHSTFIPNGERQLHDSTLMRILQAKDPRSMKSLGRACPNFDPSAWDKANMAIVTAACLARAEADPDLSAIYKDNFSATTTRTVPGRTLKRNFVEGSPGDRIWGVGLGFDDRNIDDTRNWRGENRLGRCHDEACRLYNASRHAVEEEKTTLAPTADNGEKQEEDKMDEKETQDRTVPEKTNDRSTGTGNTEEKNLGTWSRNPWA